MGGMASGRCELIPNPRPTRGARNQQVARAGEYFVVAELDKHGAFAVTFAGNMPKIDLMACNQDQSRTIHIQVKTKRGGRSWHSSIVGSHPMDAPASPFDVTDFWVFVDLAVHGVDYLLTWNCRHLANAQITRRISLVCERFGLRMPVICTPEELMGD